MGEGTYSLLPETIDLSSARNVSELTSLAVVGGITVHQAPWVGTPGSASRLEWVRNLHRFYVEPRYRYAPKENVRTQLLTVTVGFRYCTHLFASKLI
jgi:hypothetical protein